MGRKSSGPKPKKRKKVLVTPAVKMQDGKLTEPYRILTELIEKHRADLMEADIIILWRSGWRADADGWVRMFGVKKAGDVDHALAVKADFAVMLNKENWPRLPEQMKTIYMHQITCHMKPLMDSDGEQKQNDKGRKQWRVRKKADIEQFNEVVKEYGEEALQLDANALAAVKDSERPLLGEAEKNGSGKGKAEKDEKPGATVGPVASPAASDWRGWMVEELGKYGLPPGKVKLLESEFANLGKLMESLAKAEEPGFWYKEIKGLGEAGYDAMTEAIAKMRTARPEFAAADGGNW